MINYEKTTTIKIGKDTYKNNLEKKIITKNDETITQYCILAIDEKITTIMQGNKISIKSTRHDPDKEILQVFLSQPKTKKTTSKEEGNKGGK